MKKWLLTKKLGFVLLVACSFIVSSHLAVLISINSVKQSVPDFFNVIIYQPPDKVSMKKFNEINNVVGSKSFFIPKEKVKLFNQELARQYTGYGGTWTFEILSEDLNRQYIHVVASGDDDIIESWYWATDNQIIPDKYRWLNPGVIWIVLPLTIVLTISGIFIYKGFKKKFWSNNQKKQLTTFS